MPPALGIAAVPAALVPTRFRQTTADEHGSSRRRPCPPLPERTLPSFTPVPPTTRPVPEWHVIPSLELPRSAVPLVPIQLPLIATPLCQTRMPGPLNRTIWSP